MKSCVTWDRESNGWSPMSLTTKPFAYTSPTPEDLVHKHAEASGFPATKVTEIITVYDPSTEHAT